MKPLYLFVVLFVIFSHQIASAENSERVRQLENEINSLKQATSNQGEGIQSLESRVTSRGQVLSTGKSPSGEGDSKTDDGHDTNKSNREKEVLDRKYID